MNKIHNYEISSSLGKPVIFTHDDEKLFNVLFRRVIRLNQILEMWNFGLCFTDNGQVYWVDLDQHKYSSFNSYPVNDAHDIKLTLAVFTYPLSLANEIWSQSASVLFFEDIVQFMENKSAEIRVLEALIRKHLNGIELSVIELNAKDGQYKDKTCFELIKEYLQMVDKSNFEKTVAEFKCDKSQMAIITNKGLVIYRNRNTESTKYNWMETPVFKTKDAICDIILQKDGIKKKLQIKLTSPFMVEQFEYVCTKHICQHAISTNAEKDPEFKILEDLSSKEQKYIKKAVHLQAQLSKIVAINESLKKENNDTKEHNETLRNNLIEKMKKIEELEYENETLKMQQNKEPI